jgi:hypothetical protein
MANMRTLDEIAVSIHAADRANVFTVGALLMEAKDACDHGQWGPWLEEEFEWSQDTAENYMRVTRVAAKFRKFRNLKVPKVILYEVAGKKDEALQATMIEALAERATKATLKATEAYQIIELVQLRHEHGDLPEAALWALNNLPILTPWTDAAAAALKDQKPDTEEGTAAIVQAAQREYEAAHPPESVEPEPEPEAEDDKAEAEPSTDDEPEHADEGVETEPPPSELLEALMALLHYARRPRPTKVSGISGVDLIEVKTFIEDLHKTLTGASERERIADAAEARSRRTAAQHNGATRP